MASASGVNGIIQENDLGLTLPHEHLFIDLSCYWNSKLTEEKQPTFFGRMVSRELRNEVQYHPWALRDNTILDDLDSALLEASAFVKWGGRTIVDMSASTAVGRNPKGLLAVAAGSGVNVIMASGRYTEPSMTEQNKRMSINDVESVMLKEFTDGVDDTGIKPGVLKVGFVSTLDKEPELRSLRAAGRAQRKIGCALSIHPHIWEPDSHSILDMLEEEGCDLRRVILCHQDYLGHKVEYLDSLVKRGAYIEFDTFGSGWINDRMWQKCDHERIGFVQRHIELGNTNNILISGDMCLKIMLSKWGGVGYINIPKYVLPEMVVLGIDKEQIYTITVENPKRVFCH